VDTWNSHDLDAILALYADDATLTSPLAERLTGKGTVYGKAALRSYFARGLEKYPELHFELLEVFASVGSLTLLFRSIDERKVAEVLSFDADLRVTRVVAHYA
jgi:hypothetical protein